MYGIVSLLTNRFLSVTELWTLGFRCKQYWCSFLLLSATAFFKAISLFILVCYCLSMYFADTCVSVCV